MSDKGIFRSAVSGFNKTDVLTYIDQITGAWDAERQGLVRQAENAAAEAEKMSASLQESYARQQAAREDLATAEAELEELRPLRDSAQTQTAELDAAREEAAAAKAETEALQNELTLVREELAAAKAETEALQNELTLVREELAAAKDELATALDDRRTVQDDLCATRDELAAVKEKLAAALTAAPAPAPNEIPAPPAEMIMAAVPAETPEAAPEALPETDVAPAVAEDADDKDRLIRQLQDRIAEYETLMRAPGDMHDRMTAVLRPFMEDTTQRTDETLENIRQSLIGMKAELDKLETAVSGQRIEMRKNATDSEDALSSLLQNWLDQAKVAASRNAPFFR